MADDSVTVSEPLNTVEVYSPEPTTIAIINPTQETTITADVKQITVTPTLYQASCYNPVLDSNPNNPFITEQTTECALAWVNVREGMTSILLEWAETDSWDHDHTEIWRSQTNSWAGAYKVGSSKTNVYVDPVEAGYTYFYWLLPIGYNGKAGTPSVSIQARSGQNPEVFAAALGTALSVNNISDSLRAGIAQIARVVWDEELYNLNTDWQTFQLALDTKYEGLLDSLNAIVGDLNGLDVRTLALIEQLQTISQNDLMALSEGLASLSAQMLAGDQASTALINEVQRTLATADTDLAEQITTLSAALTSETSARNAAIREERTVRVNEYESLAQTVSQLNAAIIDETSARNAAITEERTVRTNSYETLATSVSELSASLTSETSALNAAILREQTARVTELGAYTSTLDSLTTEFNTGLANALSGIQTERISRVEEDAALAQQITDLTANFESEMGNANASIFSTDIAVAGLKGEVEALAGVVEGFEGDIAAVSGTVSRYETEIGDNKATLTALQGTINGINAQWTIKTDVNGRVAGIGLINDATAGSTFEITADRFKVINPDTGVAIIDAGGVTANRIEGVNLDVLTNDLPNLVQDFNNQNNRNTAAISAPTIATNGTAIDHIMNSDGSADISFEWSWGYNEADIDGFAVFYTSGTSATAASFGVNSSNITSFQIKASSRVFVLSGVPADKYYTFGVCAYRKVDTDVNPDGVIHSAIVKPTLSSENPYRPSTSVAFAGNVTGTINGYNSNTVVNWAASGSTFTSSDAGNVAYLDKVSGTYIDNLAVSTLKIANNAVTIPVMGIQTAGSSMGSVSWATATSGTTLSGYSLKATCSVYNDQSSYIDGILMVAGRHGTTTPRQGDNFAAWSAGIKWGSQIIAHAGGSAGDWLAWNGKVTLQPGWNNFYLYTANISPSTTHGSGGFGGCSITILGCKK